jgi:hypothetical protein
MGVSLASRSDTCAVKDSIYFEIADLLTHKFYPHLDEQRLADERNRLCRAALSETADARRTKRRWTKWSHLRDYIEGAALSLNPLPSACEATFIESDVAALEADWLSVRNDISCVWSAFLELQNQSQQEGDNARQGHKPGPTGGTATADRDHTNDS